jgi:hypothetical protein
MAGRCLSGAVKDKVTKELKVRERKNFFVFFS